MERRFTSLKCANRINVNTYKRVLYPHFYKSVTPSSDSSVISPSSDSSVISPSPSVSKVTCLPWYVRFVLWIKRNIFKITC